MGTPCPAGTYTDAVPAPRRRRALCGLCVPAGTLVRAMRAMGPMRFGAGEVALAGYAAKAMAKWIPFCLLERPWT